MGQIVDRLKGRLIEIFRESPNINRSLEIYGEELEELQLAADDFLENFNLANVEGTVLDKFGELLTAPPRQVGMSDTVYRNVCYAQILINIYKGTIDELLAFFTTLGATGITYRELGNANVRIQYTGLDPAVFPPSLILTTLRGGTHPITYDISYYTATPFGFLGNPNAYPFGTGTLGTRE